MTPMMVVSMEKEGGGERGLADLFAKPGEGGRGGEKPDGESDEGHIGGGRGRGEGRDERMHDAQW